MKKLLLTEEHSALSAEDQHKYSQGMQNRLRAPKSPNPWDWDDGLPPGIHWDDDYETRVVYNLRPEFTPDKYLVKEVGTSGGFWDDLSSGYINPEQILTDQDRALQLKEAIKLLSAWESELKEDDILNEF